MRRFYLVHKEDVSGISGTGIVAEGCHFSTGKVTLSWVTQFRSVVVYDSMDDVHAIHGHGGKTVVEYLDEQGEWLDGVSRSEVDG